MRYPSFSLIVLLWVAATLAAPSAAGAQVRLTVDNDLFAPRGAGDAPPDYEYTHGLRVSWLSDRARWWAAPLGVRGRACGGADADSGEPCLRTRFEAGQQIFTPRYDAVEPLPGERPYAGWLYAAATAEEARPGRLRSLGVDVGVVGPPSLAREVQTGLHRLAGFREPLGWAHQLRTEPGVVVRYRESRALARVAGAGGFSAVVAPEWGADAGNVRTGARIGVRAGAGYGGASAPAGKAGLVPDGRVFVLAGARAEWVVRNLFLDGNTFRSGPRVGKRPLVPEGELGVGVRMGRVELRYTAVLRGREYRTQEEPHAYGSLTLTLRRDE